ncbi:MAG TPA: fructose 1,6-bisphosphatase [Burkholderiaceae bacterium]|nr:fructose 1,6-bisphosphatase [Burkholderiaceae bacterium]
MKITVSVIKADVGSIGGRIAPSALWLDTVRSHIAAHAKGLIIDGRFRVRAPTSARAAA